MTSSYLAPAASQAYTLDLVRRADRDRFLGALFAPEPARRGLLALDHELGRTRSVTREPLLARMRLQWWREAAQQAAGGDQPRAQPIAESLSETARRHRLTAEQLVALVDAHEDEVDGPLDVQRAGYALADLELAVLGVDDAASRRAARAIATAWLMGDGSERDTLLAEARGLRGRIDRAVLPILLPALSLGGIAPWRRPLAYWWSAKRGRY